MIKIKIIPKIISIKWVNKWIVIMCIIWTYASVSVFACENSMKERDWWCVSLINIINYKKSDTDNDKYNNDGDSL